MSVREGSAAPRPAVLIVEADDERRRALTHGLTAAGYDVTPAMTAQEGLRFARGLGPSVIVGPVELIAAGGAEILQHCVHGDVLERTILLLGESEAGDRQAGGELPDEVRFLPTAGRSFEEILDCVRLLLVGRELGIEADHELRYLVGELTLAPFLEVVRSLERCRLTGRLELEDGFVAFDNGAVVAAGMRQLQPGAARLGAGTVRDVKAFCRLARRRAGPFYVMPRPAGDEREIGLSVPELVVRALEESQVELPPPRARLRITGGGDMPSGQFATHQNLLLDVISRCDTVEELLDSVPSTDARISQALEKMMASGLVSLERPRAAVAILTDSTADLPPKLVREHDITVAPLSVVFGDEVLRDGVDIQPRDFYNMLESEPHHPATLPPSEAEFFEHFASFGEERDVVGVHISAALSKTIENATRAAERTTKELGPAAAGALEIVDSRSASLGVGLLALFAARMAIRGESASAIAQRLRAMAPRLELLMVVNTLDYLERGGRIGKAGAWVGKLLGIKPILGMVDGEITPVDRVRRGRDAHPRIVQLLRDRVDAGRPLIVAIAHARAPVWADRLKDLVKDAFDVSETVLSDIGPVVGTHCGPGTVGVVAFQPTSDEQGLIAPLE